VAVLAVAFLFSNNKSRINYRLVLSGLLMQGALAFIILRTQIGRTIFRISADSKR